MATNTTEIIFKVTKQGAGAQDVLNDLKKIEQSSAKIGATSAVGLQQISSNFKTLSGSLRGMDLFGALPGQLGASLSRMQGMLSAFTSSARQAQAARPQTSGGATDMFADVVNMSSFEQSIGALNANLANTATNSVAATSAVGALAPVLVMGGVAAAGAALAIGKLAYSLGTEGETIVQTQKRFEAFVGGPQKAAAALADMQRATEGGLTSMSAMSTASMLLSMGLARNGEQAADLTRMALMLGPAYRDASTNMQDFTMLLANQSVRRLDQFGLSIDAVKNKQKEFVAAGMDSQLAFTNAVLEIGAQKMALLTAAGVEAATGAQRLTSSWADLRAEVAKGLAPGVSQFQTGLASSLTELTNSFRANSGDVTTQLIGLQAQMESVRATYQTMLANGVDPNGPYMQQYANTLADIESKLITVRLAASDFGEAAGVAGIRAADGLTYTAAGVDNAIGALSALDDALQGLRDKDESAKVNTVAAAIMTGEISRATVAVIGLNAAFIELNKNKLGAMFGPEFWTSIQQPNEKPPLQRTDFTQSAAIWQGGGAGDFYGAMFQADRTQDTAEADAAARKRQEGIRLTQAAAERALSAIQARFAALASAVTSALDDARAKAKGLFDLSGGGGAGIVTEPGKGGPFEAIYQILDVAATQAGRAPGADTAMFAQRYAGQDVTGISRNFQRGNLLAPGVFENINWEMLGQAGYATAGSSEDEHLRRRGGGWLDEGWQTAHSGEYQGGG